MSNAIYVDLLVIINLYITFFLLKGTAVFLHRAVTNRRLLLGSLLGGLSSLIVILPAIPVPVNSLLRLASGFVIVLLAFGFKSRGEFLKTSLIFVIINVVFAGFTLMLWFFAAPLGMQWTGGIVYFDISFAMLIFTTAAAYGVIRLLRYILDVKHAADREYTVTITMSGDSVTLAAIADSGNMLTDYFTGLPVIVVSGSAGLNTSGLLPRLLPYNTIDSAGLISVYKAEKIIIKTAERPDKPVKALIGISDKNATDVAVFNPRLLI
jgi:stage II sporulation protein GA (sporulation sigma-E factor processing peptidase)